MFSVGCGVVSIRGQQVKRKDDTFGKMADQMPKKAAIMKQTPNQSQDQAGKKCVDSSGMMDTKKVKVECQYVSR